MSEPYRQCKECGKRALEFATRCPGCGVALPNPVPFEPDAGPDLGRFLSLKVVFAVVATGTLLASFQRGAVRAAPPDTETSFVTPVSSERPAIERALPAARVSTALMPRRDSTTVAAPATGAEGVPLIAKGWTNVRSHRTVNAKLEAILTPGDTVTADSLVNGWYRVALYDEVLGYARESTLSPIR